MHDLIPIVMFVGLFTMVLGIYYLRSKENMAMLDKGLNPRDNSKNVSVQPFMSLKLGLLLVGAGLGLFTAYMLDATVFAGENHTIDTAPLYPSLIGIGGGLGLIISYGVEKKHWQKNKVE